MSNLIPKISRIKPGGECAAAEAILLSACAAATIDRRPFTVVSGYDSEKIGSYTEYTIWYENTEAKP